ncbi:MAG TPA: MBL fold metallo-hydrolase [Mycobacteriales bacterium]|nr:MBL fold metallo-hydrolase [Mycobacteriales bacterium]
MNGGPRLRVETIRTDELGDRSYVVHDGEIAFVIDPQRDIDRISEMLGKLGLVLGSVGETHIHNDYVTGGLNLARSAGVPYLVARSEEVAYERTPVDDASMLQVGSLHIRVVATPGHTPGHLSYVVTGSGGETAVFSGGSLLYGAVGRTDLIDESRTRELTRAQYRSVRELTAPLPDEVRLFPTHGFGSFCASGPPGKHDSASGTLGDERRSNAALAEDDEDGFVERTIAGFTPYPSYYVHMAPRNRAGAPPADLSPPQIAGSDQIGQRLSSGEWVVDIRDRRSFAADHLAGTVAVELGPQFATYLGWIYPYDEPLSLLAETAEQVAAAQRQLVRIGIDRPAAAAYGDLAEIAPNLPRRSFPIATFVDLADALGIGAQVIDVRRPDEVVRDGAIPGSWHVPLADLAARMTELPQGVLWIHCASGFRATIAASLLDRADRDVVLVDDPFATAIELDLVSATAGRE